LTEKEIMYMFYVYTFSKKEAAMTTARVFKSGNSQAIRLPKEFRVESRELEIFRRRGREIILREPEANVTRAFDLLSALPDDFLRDRAEEPPQPRDGL